MHAKEYVVSSFALVILLFFCSPIFALALGIWYSVAPSAFALKMFVGLTNGDVVNSLHSLLLPLVGAVIIFRSDYFVGLFGTLVLLVLCTSIILGFFVFLATNPAIFGTEPRFEPYISEYKNVHNSIFSMIGMLILLFLAKLGLTEQAVVKPVAVTPKLPAKPEDPKPDPQVKSGAALTTGQIQPILPGAIQ
jgi:hypothetical protein